MKKIALFLLLVLCISFVFAAQNGNLGNQAAVHAGNQEQNQQQNAGIGQELSEQIRERKQEIKAGEYNLSQGQLLQVREMAQNLIQLRVRNVSSHTSLNLSGEFDEMNRTRLRVRLSDNNEAEIKVMPNVASETALNRLRLRACNETNNCTIQLKEARSGNNARAAYEIQVERHYKLLGLFQAKAQNRIQIDAENGEVIQTKKPWWGFLASSD